MFTPRKIYGKLLKDKRGRDVVIRNIEATDSGRRFGTCLYGNGVIEVMETRRGFWVEKGWKGAA